MERKMLVLIAACLLVMVSVSQATITYMDGTLHNGALTAQTYGYWHNTPAAVPAGWTYVAGYPWQTATMLVEIGSTGEGINNTGELVQAGYAFTVNADLGGGVGVHPWVRVYATEFANGTGNKVLLASVDRVGLASDGAHLAYPTLGTQGAPAAAGLAGYYVQVRIGGPWSDFNYYISGNYDNIGVTAEYIPEPATLALLGLGALVLRKRK